MQLQMLNIVFDDGWSYSGALRIATLDADIDRMVEHTKPSSKNTQISDIVLETRQRSF